MHTPFDEGGEALLRRADALLDEMSVGSLDFGEAGWMGEVSSPETSGSIENKTSPAVVDAGEDDVFADALKRSVGSNRSKQEEWTQGNQSAVYRSEIASSAVQSSTGFRDVDRGVDGRRLEEDVAGPVQRPTLIPAEQRYAQSARYVSADEATTSVNGAMRPSASASPVRRQSTSPASTMTVGGRLGARSLLLPRELETDVEKAQQEIQALLAEITAALPAGHEAAQRSRHLLQKAQHILQEDPSRTAEVDYYLQQVRRIVQRTRQMQNDSALYRRRLTVYLGAWTALAAAVLIARYWLQSDLLALLDLLFWRSEESVWVQFVPMWIGAVFAGALGAAIGALYTMQRHATKEYGYFDRKYGLRGLILPFLGGLFGTMLATLWAVVCIFLDLNPQALWIGSAPAVFAFVLGLIQEWLYGVR
ncbi:MAG: hypothetical protein NZ553_03765 [Caldilinea sp.]|nr:hypothetical protein [Caldilinea sp.]MDW8439569.1 hypothetical protein [Caldilineaceae bacterium]